MMRVSENMKKPMLLCFLGCDMIDMSTDNDDDEVRRMFKNIDGK